MQIVFTGAETSFTKTAKGGYSTMTITYVDERGANKSWKIRSFANPKVFDTLKNAANGDVFEIETTKNKDDFTEWASATKVDGGSKVAAAGTTATKTPVVSQYETRDERNLRQRLIVRQSCLAQAIAFSKDGGDATISEQDLLEQADRFVAWVFEAPALFEDVPQ
jgi:hypothetical protein